MKLHFSGAWNIGSIIVEPQHKPFRALACPVKIAVIPHTPYTR